MEMSSMAVCRWAIRKYVPDNVCPQLSLCLVLKSNKRYGQRMEITNIESFLKYYESVRKRTTRVIETIPPERIDWTPKPGFFTFGDLIRHIASIERYMFAENARGNWSQYPGYDRSLADGYEACCRFFETMHA